MTLEEFQAHVAVILRELVATPLFYYCYFVALGGIIVYLLACARRGRPRGAGNRTFRTIGLWLTTAPLGVIAVVLVSDHYGQASAEYTLYAVAFVLLLELVVPHVHGRR